jgi:hypothetical protein
MQGNATVQSLILPSVKLTIQAEKSIENFFHYWLRQFNQFGQGTDNFSLKRVEH